jgi:dTMP kinase
MTGKLIALEGIDGSGKGSQARRLLAGIPGAILLTYPDKNWAVGKVIASFLSKKVKLSPAHQFLLYLSDIHKDQETIRLMLQEGKTVILDRYLFSTLAYQDASGFEMEQGMAIVNELDFIEPDVTVLLDIPPSVSIERKKKQNKSLEFFEREKFLEKVRKNYLALAEEGFLSKEWLVLGGEGDEAGIFEQISRVIEHTNLY